MSSLSIKLSHSSQKENSKQSPINEINQMKPNLNNSEYSHADALSQVFSPWLTLPITHSHQNHILNCHQQIQSVDQLHHQLHYVSQTVQQQLQNI